MTNINYNFDNFIFDKLQTGYKVENDKVYYEYWNEGSGQGKRLIEQADANISSDRI